MTEPLTSEELAIVRRLHADETADWMPEDGYPIRGGLSAYGVIEILLATPATVGPASEACPICGCPWPTMTHGEDGAT